jgi:carboxyl-terminal processing protease
MRCTSRPAPPDRRRGGLRCIAIAALVAATACSSGEKGRSIPPSDAFAARCNVPRAGLDPWTGTPYPDQQGTLQDEKTWVRSWIDELYLWYGEVPDANPSAYGSVTDYFGVLRTYAVTASGRDKDRFHFWAPTDAWQALSQSGVEAGYGVQWVILSQYPPRRAVAAWVEPGSPAALGGIARGTDLLGVDGVDVESGTDVDTLNAGMSPATAGETHTLTVRDALGTREVTLTSSNVEYAPVPTVRTIATGSGTVGYILFNDHVATAEDALVTAFSQLRDAQVSDLVLDLRYNGGGYLYIASQVAYMIAGGARTAGKTFERLVFNDRYGATDPWGDPNTPFPFLDVMLGTATPGASLPTLGLGRVFVLTGSGTCSASESIVNSLLGIGVQVIQVGATTCGKPYGFVPQDNCGTTYFAVQFQGVNQAGFGSYGDGFVPGGTGPAGVAGCAIVDDYGHALGDAAEARLAAALSYRATGSCYSAAAASGLAKLGAVEAAEGEVVKSPWRRSRILVP